MRSPLGPSAFILLACTSFAQWTGTAHGLLPSAQSISALDAVDADVVWAVTGDPALFWNGDAVPPGHQPAVLRTTDGGASWDAFTVPGTLGRFPWTLVAVSAQEMYFTAGTNNSNFGTGLLFYTLDGGVSWATRTQAGMANGIGLFLHRFNADDWFAYSYGHSARSVDGGVSWTDANEPALQSGEAVTLMSAVNASAQVGDRVWIGTSRGRVLTSADKGATWSVLLSGFNPGRAIHSMAFHDAQNGMAASCWNSSFADVPMQLMRTDDGGANWAVVNAPDDVLGCIASVPGLPGAYVGVSDGWTGSVSYLTLDDGATWQQVDAGTPYMSVEFTSPEHGWAGAGYQADPTGPALYKWTGGPLGTGDRQGPVEVRVSPNPTRGPITVMAPGMAGHVRVQLLDMHGRTVRAFNAVTDADQVRVDVSGASAGLHVLELTGADFRRQVRVQVVE